MTGGEYRLTATAEEELGDVLLHLADIAGPVRALRVHAHFVRAFEGLARHPGSGHTRPDLTGAYVRWWTVFQWIVLYDPRTAPLTILRVIHGARALDRILRPDDQA